MTVHTPNLDDLRRYGHGRIWRSGSTDGCITTVQMNIHLSNVTNEECTFYSVKVLSPF